MIKEGVLITEQDVLDHADFIISNTPMDYSSLNNEYIFLANQYKKLLKQSEKLIAMADNNQKKLFESNLIVQEKVHKLTKAEKKLTKLCITDSLTGLNNRRGINNCFDYNIKRCQRNNTFFSILILDIDHFKVINDTYGHITGDYVLKTLSKNLKKSLRSQDELARWGGEEFLIVLPETDCNGAKIFAEKIRKEVEKMPLKLNNFKRGITISIGGCSFNKNMDITECIDLADKALYKSKSDGRNRSNFCGNG